jgi:hypothetical protein
MKKPFPSVELSLAIPPVTKRQRLQRFADVIQSGPPCPLHLFINLEYRDAGEWKYLSHPGSPFALAAQDNVLHAAGLRSGSVGDAQRFFELSREELAEFHVYAAARSAITKWPDALSASPPTAPHEEGAVPRLDAGSQVRSRLFLIHSWGRTTDLLFARLGQFDHPHWRSEPTLPARPALQ